METKESHEYMPQRSAIFLADKMADDCIGKVIRPAVDLFRVQFGTDPAKGVVAPGRVNIIGEHTDYNEGFVLPMAINKYTGVVGRKTSSDVIRIYSEAFKELLEFPAAKPLPSTPTSDEWNELCKENHWGNYVKGTIAQYFNQHSPEQGAWAFDAVITSSVPLGAGLSSSASLEVAMYTFLEELTGVHTERPIDKALNCQKAEHEYAKVPCGIMDQFVVTMAKKNEALLIDCREPYPVQPVPLLFTDPKVVILVTDSKVKHKLSEASEGSTEGEYKKRRSTCEKVAGILGLPALRDATMRDLEAVKDSITEVEYKRAQHVIKEIERTQNAVALLPSKKFEEFGQLMVQSHMSLKDDYEVSCDELNDLVGIATSVKGVYGSRMTGGGFGGCTVTLVREDAVEDCKAAIKGNYPKDAECFVFQPCEGARKIDLPQFL